MHQKAAIAIKKQGRICQNWYMDFSGKAFTLTVELCAQVLRQQTRASEYVREGVEKNKVGNNNHCDLFSCPGQLNR